MKKSKIFGKRMVVLAVLITALSAAVYLNWRYTVKEGDFDLSAIISQTTTQKHLGDVQYVNENIGTSNVETDFFAKTKNDRDSKRKESIKTLQEVIDNVKSNDDAKTKAAEQIAKFTQLTENESSIEALIKGKGFKNIVVVITDDYVNAMVKIGDNGLLASDTIQIEDIITSTLKISIEKIKIIEVK